MTYVLEKAVKDEAQKYFEGTELETAIGMLESTPLPMDQAAPPPRVHIAVLWLAEGNIKKLASEIENASCDWRDTLLAAGLADENWPELMAAKGINALGWLQKAAGPNK